MSETIHTQGLPNKTFLHQRYEFNVSENNFLGIPGDYIGRDHIGYPLYREQLDWLNNYCTENGEALYNPYGYWEFKNLKVLEKLITILKTHQGIKGDYLCANNNDLEEQLTIHDESFDKIDAITLSGKIHQTDKIIQIDSLEYDQHNHVLTLVAKSIGMKFVITPSQDCFVSYRIRNAYTRCVLL